MLDYPVSLVGRVLDARFRGPRGSEESIVRRVTTDSRKIEPGDLFFALSGERFDAHEFVPNALKAGAAAAVVQARRVSKEIAKEGALLEVPDPLKALGDLALWHRNRFSVRVVAVTGSVGKTTTKDLIHGVLSQQWKTLKNPGNLNAEIGLPLTLFELTREHETAVVEMAMRGPGQIRYLARIARPEVAVITNIGLSHLELLGSQDNIAAAKAEVLDFLPHGGAAVLNADDTYFAFLRERVPAGAAVLPFGMDGAGDEGVHGVYLGPVEESGKTGERALGTRFTLRPARGHQVRWGWLPLLGRHNLRNALAAAAVGQALGMSWQRIGRGLSGADMSAMRMAVHHLPDGSILLDDAYNASSPEAMLAALQVLQEVPGDRKVAVLGSMLELGEASPEAHQRVGAAVAEARPALLVTVGELGRGIAEAAQAGGLDGDSVIPCESNEAALSELAGRRRPGDVILVKGSRGVAMEHVVQGLVGAAARPGRRSA
jgi:UDP-N-acetylmuramoyl-tripeptide--D-alanyl-D-alanine ligase